MCVCVRAHARASTLVALFADAVTSPSENASTINTNTTTKTPAITTNAGNPELYIFSFPESAGQRFSRYQQQLAIATTRPQNVTLYVSTCCDARTASVTYFGPFVINNSSDTLIVPLAGSAYSSSDLLSVNVSSSDKINVYAYNYFTYNIDALQVRDVSQLGLYYEVMTLSIGTSPLSTFSRSFFVVTASEDNTSVEIRKQQSLKADLSAFTSSAPVPFQVS